jgi:hypothetical protein
MTDPVHATSPQPEEPRTPLWMPALGAALFLTVGLVWAATPPPVAPVSTEGDAGEEAAAADAGAPPAIASAAPSARPSPMPMKAVPSASAAPAASALIAPKLPPKRKPPPKAGPAH